MDQGLAALAGAGVGVVGTLFASFLAYLATRRQARDQGAVDHVRALRGERREAYLAFLVAAEPVDGVLHRVAHGTGVSPDSARDAAPSEEVLRAAVDDLGAAVAALYKSQALLELMGPGAVAAEAVQVWSEVRSLRTYLEKSLDETLEGELSFEGYRNGLEDAVDEVEVSRERFLRRAREVMESPP